MSCSDWKNMKEHPAGRAMARTLLWGYYWDGKLQTALAAFRAIVGRGEKRK